MGAQVFGYDVRAAAAEQIASMGATFLKVENEEDGAGSGGYVDKEAVGVKTAALDISIYLSIPIYTHLYLSLPIIEWDLRVIITGALLSVSNIALLM
jgi:hypothetical protein